MRSASILLALAAGCASTEPAGPYAPADEAARNTVRAQELSRSAADILYAEPEEAEELLRESLSADIFFGPAHNTLGVLYLHQGKLYEAAREFEWARKLMPGHPDPRMNLALTLERAGQLDEAIQTYETALEVYPGHIATEQALASLYLRTGEGVEDLPGMLERISLGGETEQWREWARVQSGRIGARSP